MIVKWFLNIYVYVDFLMKDVIWSNTNIKMTFRKSVTCYINVSCSYAIRIKGTVTYTDIEIKILVYC